MASQDQKMKNLQAILKWSIAQEDGSNGSKDDNANDGRDIQPMDSERKAHLEKVLESMSVSTVDEMYRIFSVMQLHPDTKDVDVTAARIAALEQLQNIIEDIDNASDFVKIGGVGVCYAALNDKDERVLKLSISCLASAAQNHPTVQEYLFTSGALNRFLVVVQDQKSSASLLEKALRGISCLIRGQDKMIETFIRNKGVQSLVGILERKSTRTNVMITKIAYLSASLADEFPRFCVIMRVTGLIDRLIESLYENKDDNVWEQVLNALANCSIKETTNQNYLRSNDRLVTLLGERSKFNATRSADDQGALMEEMEYSKIIKGFISNGQ